LSSSTTYHFYIYVDLATLTVTVVKSSQSAGLAAETQQVIIQVANADGRVCVRPDATGATTASGTGGGSGGGGSSGCFTGSVEIATPDCWASFEVLPEDRPFDIVNNTGKHRAQLVKHENFAGWMIKLAGDKMVTLDHSMKLRNGWVPASEMYADRERVWFEGTVYNIHVMSDDEDDKHYLLFNGDTAHNLKPAP
jgi:hypothetical protein